MYCWSKSRVLCLKRNKTWRTQELRVEKISWSLADILQLPWFNRQQITTPRAPLRIMLQIFQNINSTEIIKIARMEASEARYGCVGLNLISEHVPSTALVSLKSCFLCPGGERGMTSLSLKGERSFSWHLGSLAGDSLVQQVGRKPLHRDQRGCSVGHTEPPTIWDRDPAIRSRAFSKSQGWMTLAFNGCFLPSQCL